MRNKTISIMKALAIILMVIGHADSPSRLTAFLYEFHMPLFFVCAGFFFSLKYLSQEATFVKRRFKGLYLPFLKWSVFFLLIHNLMFDIGLLNERYGNWSGGVTHPYTWHQAQQRLWNIVTAMGGYDEFLCGAFWFFRALLVASISWLVVYKLADWAAGKMASRRKLPCQTLLTTLLCCLFFLFLAGWKTYAGLRIVNLVQGGYRDLMGAFFFGCGFLFRQLRPLYRPRWWNTLLFAAVVAWFSVYATANMNWKSTFDQFLWLPIPALCGCLMTYNIASYLERRPGPLRSFLCFCGDNTLPIFVFHIISFKLVSALKIMYYGMDWQQIGCHMVIHDHAHEDYFWILYTIVGVGLPLLCTWCWQRISQSRKLRVKKF